MTQHLSSSITDSSQERRSEGRRLRSRFGDPGRVYWSASQGKSDTLWTCRDLVTAMRNFSRKGEGYAICIIEDITKNWADEIEVSMEMDPDFFPNHFDRYWDAGFRPWYWEVESEQRHDLEDSEVDQRWRTIDSVYSLRRSARSRISYYRVNERIYIFLVDKPPYSLSRQRAMPTPREPRGRNRTSLLFKHSVSRRVIVLPALFDSRHSTHDLFGLLQTKHQWLLNCLFVKIKTSQGHPSAFRAHPLVYVLIAAAWEHNLQLLATDVKGVIFNNMEKPHRDILRNLYGLREDLDYIKSEVEKASHYAQLPLVAYFDMCASSEWFEMETVPMLSLEDTQRDATVLEHFLTDSLNLLLASIALRDSERSDILIWLAGVYVPFTFVTGISGMNIQELKDPGPPVWLYFEVQGVVLLVTAAMVWFYKNRGHVMARILRRREVDHGPD